MVKRRRFLEQAKKYAVRYVRTALPADPESLIGKAVDFVLSDEYISIILKEIGACTSKILDETIDINRCYSDLIRTLTDDIHFICRHRMLPFDFSMSDYPDFIKRPVHTRAEAIQLIAENNDEISKIVSDVCDMIAENHPEFPDIRSDAELYSNNTAIKIVMHSKLSPVEAIEKELNNELVLDLFDY